MSARIDLHNVTAVTSIEQEPGLDGTFWVTRLFLKLHDGSESRITLYSNGQLPIPAAEDLSVVAMEAA